jgi:hypothetical protein
MTLHLQVSFVEAGQRERSFGVKLTLIHFLVSALAPFTARIGIYTLSTSPPKALPLSSHIYAMPISSFISSNEIEHCGMKSFKTRERLSTNANAIHAMTLIRIKVSLIPP